MPYLVVRTQKEKLIFLLCSICGILGQPNHWNNQFVFELKTVRYQKPAMKNTVAIIGMLLVSLIIFIVTLFVTLLFNQSIKTTLNELIEATQNTSIQTTTTTYSTTTTTTTEDIVSSTTTGISKS